jgi:hypothetical protein
MGVQSPNSKYVVECTGTRLDPPNVVIYGPESQEIMENVLMRIEAGQTSNRKILRPHKRGEKTIPISHGALPDHLQ